MQRKRRIIIGMLAAGIILSVIVLWIVSPNENISSHGFGKEHFLSAYDARRESLFNATEIMPAVESLPANEGMIYQYKKTPWIFPLWYAETMLLAVTYDDETFADELDEINNNYDDLPETVTISVVPGERGQTTASAYFSIHSYDFRIIETGDAGTPKEFGMIAVSKEKRKIVYLYFYDFDLDRITPPMSTFITRHFNYLW
ncbi:MAG: hypothetical protein LUG13_00830 [Oscillospiraceae bacterium]|nr:hypothetical protein [Oscillospiraceae bacterium]